MQLKLKNTFVYTILGFLPLSFSLVFTPVYTQYLSKVDYGLLNLFNMISGLLIPFYGLGIDQAAGFLYWDYHKEKSRLGTFMSTTLMLLLGVGVAISLLGILLGPWLLHVFIKDAEQFTIWPFLILSLSYPLLMTANRVLLYYYRNEGDIKRYAILNIASLLFITAGSVAGVILLKKGANGAVEGRTIGFCVIVLFFIVYELKKIGLRYERAIAQPLIRMGRPLFISTLVGSLAYVGDRLIVEEMGTLAMLGIYGFSVTIASVVEILLGALGNSFIPGIYKNILEEDTSKYENTLIQLFIYAYSLMGVVVFAAAVIIPFMKIFIAEPFFEAAQYIPLLCLAHIPRLFTQLYSLKFYKHKKTTFVLWLNVAYFFCILISGITLYRFFGLKGLALAVYLTGTLNMILARWLSKKIDDFDFGFQKLYILFALITGSILSVSFFSYDVKYLYFLFCIPLCTFIIVSIFLFQAEYSKIKQTATYHLLKFTKRKNQ